MTEILFIVFIAFLLFGTEKLPDVVRGLGKGYREFQKAADQIKEEINKVTNEVKNEATNVKEEVNNVKNDIKEDLNDNKEDTANRVG